jgi:hypothetical protein
MMKIVYLQCKLDIQQPGIHRERGEVYNVTRTVY